MCVSAISFSTPLNFCSSTFAIHKTPNDLVMTMSHGDSARYWDQMPSTVIGVFDTRDYEKLSGISSMNEGKTWDQASGQPVDNQKMNYYSSLGTIAQTNNNLNFPSDEREFSNVSPFLTGRNYRDGDLRNPTWEDDEQSPLKDGAINSQIAWEIKMADDKMNGLFWVNDPSNDTIGHSYPDYFPYKHDRRDGFNDLQRRKLDLCILAGPCGAPNDEDIMMKVLQEITFIPLPEHGH
tara:strand:+ start:326 stop:1033 length:708 start_codon:yes stop_codon:yes gene_type:complete